MSRQTLDITDFITDGSLFGLCEVASRLAGSPVFVRDSLGRAITGVREGLAQYAETATNGEEFQAPLMADSLVIGHIVMPAGSGGMDGPRRGAFERFAQLLAASVGEACNYAVQQRRRAEELHALNELSSVLVVATGVDTILEAGLRAAMEALGVEAGVIRLVDGDGRLVESARAGFAEGDQAEAPAAAAIDRAAMAGGAIDAQKGCAQMCVNDAAEAKALCAAMGKACFGAMACAGMVFRAKPVGVISLYAREERVFSEAEKDLLLSIGQQLAAAVSSVRLVEAEAESRRVKTQLRLAADVQRRMLPRKVPEIPALDIAARYAPCFDLGGDFYDFFDLGGHLGVVVGDVVGKGVAAALLMAHVRASLRAHARDLYHLGEVISLTNQALCRDTLENEFATLFYGVIDPRTLRLTYCNAGHDPPLVVRAAPAGNPPEAGLLALDAGGMVAGVDPAARYEHAWIDLRPGDVLFAYTDGLADAMSFEGEKFGGARVKRALLDILGTDPGASATRIAQHVHWEMRRFAGLNTRLDDTTIVTVRVRAPGEVRPAAANR